MRFSFHRSSQSDAEMVKGSGVGGGVMWGLGEAVLTLTEPQEVCIIQQRMAPLSPPTPVFT